LSAASPGSVVVPHKPRRRAATYTCPLPMLDLTFTSFLYTRFLGGSMKSGTMDPIAGSGAVARLVRGGPAAAAAVRLSVPGGRRPLRRRAGDAPSLPLQDSRAGNRHAGMAGMARAGSATGDRGGDPPVGSARSHATPIATAANDRPAHRTNSLDGHSRLIAAWCEDLASPDFRRTGRTPRADAVCDLGRIDAAGTGHGAASTGAVPERILAAD
jgi:hypothetical protein